MKIVLLFLNLLFVILSIHSANLSYGLYFKSHNFPGDERTTLELENGNPLQIVEETTLSFDLNIRDEVVFGLITRVFTDTHHVVDLLFAVGENNIRYPALIVDEKVYKIADQITFNHWIPVSLVFSASKEQLTLSFGPHVITVPIALKKSKSMTVSFGASFRTKPAWLDVAPVDVRDIKIYNNSKLVRHWELKNYYENISYDKIKNKPAKANNPYWLIDDHTHWKKIFTLSNPGFIQVAFNPQEEVFYLVSSEEIKIYNPVSNQIRNVLVAGGYPAAEIGNHLVYDTLSAQLISFSMDERMISVFSFETNSWSNKVRSQNHPAYWNPTLDIYQKDSLLYTFGGYGFYLYKNDLFRINMKNGEMENFKIPQIPPRFSAASAIVEEKLYIFGGRGNREGKQELSPHTYYDLYSIDLNTAETIKLWEIPEAVSQEFHASFIPATNMLYNPDDRSFYVVTTEKGGILIKIYMDKPRIEYISDRMSEILRYRDMFFNLYYGSDSEKLYTVFNKTLNDGSFDLSIYSLNFPPVKSEEVIQKAGSKASRTPLWVLFIGVVGILLFFVVIFLLKKRGKKKGEGKPVAEVFKQDDIDSDERLYFNRSKSAISLLGVFNVRDKDGKDITASFTPRLKHLLILLLVYSQKEEKGISETKMDDFLWSDKSGESARNNRNVSLRKLRVLLQQIGNVEIQTNNHFRKIIIGKDVFCDYYAAVQYMSEAKNVDNKGEDFYFHLFELLLYGPLLTNTVIDWLDNFKGDYSNDAIDVLNELLNNDNYKNNDRFRLKIANTLFSHDNLNEDALFVKCSVLYHNGKKGLAKNVYDNFCKEYEKSIGERYKVSFSSIIENDKAS